MRCNYLRRSVRENDSMALDLFLSSNYLAYFALFSTQTNSSRSSSSPTKCRKQELLATPPPPPQARKTTTKHHRDSPARISLPRSPCSRAVRRSWTTRPSRRQRPRRPGKSPTRWRPASPRARRDSESRTCPTSTSSKQKWKPGGGYSPGTKSAAQTSLGPIYRAPRRRQTNNKRNVAASS